MAGGLRLSKVAAVVADGVAPFELGIACELFGMDRSDQGLPANDFALVAVTPGPVTTTAGFAISARDDLSRLEEADLIVLPAGTWTEHDPGPALSAALRAAHGRGAHIMAICRGAFVLAATGLLDHQRATTHWRWTHQFRCQFPRVQLVPDVLYVDLGDVSTSAGTAAGIDLGLHLLRRAHGAAVAADIARRMVVAPHRQGGQAQYVRRPLPELPEAGHSLQPALDWAIENLGNPLTVDDLANRAHLAPRTFARAFVEACGTTPHRWLTTQRVDRARELLEATALPMSAVADRCGFGSTDALRAAFSRELTITPATYRRQFRSPTAEADQVRPEG